MRVPRPQRYRFHGPASLCLVPTLLPLILKPHWRYSEPRPSNARGLFSDLAAFCSQSVFLRSSQTSPIPGHRLLHSAATRPLSLLGYPQLPFSKKPRTRFTDSASHLPSLFSLLYRPSPTGGSFIGSALPPSGPACPWSPSGIAETGGRRRPRPLSLTSGP